MASFLSSFLPTQKCVCCSVYSLLFALLYPYKITKQFCGRVNWIEWTECTHCISPKIRKKEDTRSQRFDTCSDYLFSQWSQQCSDSLPDFNTRFLALLSTIHRKHHKHNLSEMDEFVKNDSNCAIARNERKGVQCDEAA